MSVFLQACSNLIDIKTTIDLEDDTAGTKGKSNTSNDSGGAVEM